MKKSLLYILTLLVSCSATVLSASKYPQSPLERQNEQMESILSKDSLKFDLSNKTTANKKNKKQKNKAENSYKLLWQSCLQYLGAKPIISASFEGGTIITDWYHEGHQDIKLNIIITTNKDQEGDLVIKAFSRIHTRNIITQANSANEDTKLAEKIRLEILENLECN